MEHSSPTRTVPLCRASSQILERSDPLGPDHAQCPTPVVNKPQNHHSQQTSDQHGTRKVAPKQPRTFYQHHQSPNDGMAVHRFHSDNNINSADQLDSANSAEKADTTLSVLEHHHSLAHPKKDTSLFIGIGSQFEGIVLQNDTEILLKSKSTIAEHTHYSSTDSGQFQRLPKSLFIGIGSQFEGIAIQNSTESSLDAEHPMAEFVHCPQIATGQTKRPPLDRYLSETAEENPWMGKQRLLE